VASTSDKYDQHPALLQLRRHGLATRLLVLVVVTTIAATVGALAVNYWNYRRMLLEHSQIAFVNDLQQRAARAQPELDSAARGGSLFLAAQRVGADTVVAVGNDSAGPSSTLAEVPAALRDRTADPLGDPGAWTQRVHVGDTPVLVVGIRPVVDSHTSDGTSMQIYGFTALTSEQAQLDRIVQVSLATAAIVVVLAAVAAFTGARRALSPLRRLDEATRALAAEDAVLPVPVTGDDEIGRLTSTFNDSSVRIKALVHDLRHREAESRRFAEDVSHELRTPLAAMLSVADVLDERCSELPDDMATAVTTLATEARRISSLVTDLLDISGPETTLNPAVAEPIELGALVLSSLRAERYLDTAVGSQIQVVDHSNGALVLADARRLHSVVVNLVSNAFRHGRPPVTVTIERRGPAIVVTVRDHGNGIAAEHTDRLFERFFKADPTRARSSGSGLGLSIVAKNVALHDGTITAHNAAGGGAEFVVELPTVERTES
jgi:two-component system sensor histidine kinase MtrB